MVMVEPIHYPAPLDGGSSVHGLPRRSPGFCVASAPSAHWRSLCLTTRPSAMQT